MTKKRGWGIISVAAVIVAAVLVCSGISSIAASSNVEAEVTGAQENPNDNTVTIGVKVKNKGSDFGGYVRIFINDYSCDNYSQTDGALTYDTYIAVAAGSEDVAAITFPRPNSVHFTDADIRLQVLDEKGKVLYDHKQHRLFDESEWYYGVLSDNPSSLLYINSYNYGYYLNNDLEQKDLTAADMEDTVTYNSIRMLVIDDYDISALSSTSIANIENWVRSGGVLVVGSGAALDETFSKFDQNFIEATLNSKSVFPQSTYYTLDYSGTMQCADINYGGGYYNRGYYSGSIQYTLPTKNEGKGAIMLVPFALSDSTLDANYFVSDLLSDFSSFINSQSSVTDPSISSDFDNLFAVMQGKGTINLPLLFISMAVYIVLVGPGIYLILKAANKREKMWVFIPVIAVAFVGITYLFSRGFSLHNKALACISVQAADGSGVKSEYIFGYNSKAKDWTIRLDDDVDAAGLYFCSSTMYDYKHTDRYYFGSARTPDGVKLTYKPKSVFSTICYRAVADNDSEFGSDDFSVELTNDYSVIEGVFTNNSDKDIKKVLLVCNGGYAIIDNVKAGESVTLDERAYDFYSSVSSELTNDALNRYERKEYTDAKYTAALATAAVELGAYDDYAIVLFDTKDSLVTSREKKDCFSCYYVLPD